MAHQQVRGVHVKSLWILGIIVLAIGMGIIMAGDGSGTEAVDGIAGAVAIVSEGDDGVPGIPGYETFDGSLVRVIVLTIAPIGVQVPYLRLMASLARALHAQPGCRGLLACSTEESMAEFFRNVK